MAKEKDKKDKSVFGIYNTRAEVESAINGFKDAGFADSEISAVLLDKLRAEEVIIENATKTPQGAALGAGSGAALGGALGWLVGIGALAVPGIGPVIAAGPLVAALAGIGIGGALGGFAGSLVGMGLSELEAKGYERRLSAGGILVAIHCGPPEEIQRAKEIMEITGAEDIACPVLSTDERKTAA